MLLCILSLRRHQEIKDIEKCGLALLDISTGDFFVSEFSYEDKSRNLLDELSRFMPKEALIPKDSEKHPEILKLTENNHILVNHYDAWQFSTDSAYKTLTGHFKTQSLEGFGCKKEDLAVNAAGAIISYIKEMQRADLTNITFMKKYNPSDYMLMDSSTIRNLELIENIRNRERKGSLLSVIDRTGTPMGARLLKQWHGAALLSKINIQKRLDAVEAFKEDIAIRNKIVEYLKDISDIERITGRLTLGTANARDLIGLKNSINKLPRIKDSISDIQTEMIKEIHSDIDTLSDIHQIIEKAIIENPPNTITEGGIIKDGCSKSLDELRAISREGKGFILNIEKKEKRGQR